MPGAVVDLTALSPLPDLVINVRLRKDPALKSTIDTAPIDRLRVTLCAIFSCSEEAAGVARTLLPPRVDDGGEKVGDGESEVSEDTGSTDDDEGDKDVEEPAVTWSSVARPVVVLARRRPRSVVCKNCLEDFDANSNTRKDCTWHPSSKKPDYDSDIWCNWYEDCHGNIDGQGDVYPEGFM